MALTPENGSVFLDDIIAEDEAGSDEMQTSRTYNIDFAEGRIGKLINNMRAIKQFVYKSIITPRGRFIAYNDDYGCEIESLMGQSLSDQFIRTEVPRMIRDSVIYDDRIDNVSGFELEREGDSLTVSFDVTVNPAALEINKQQIEDETITVLRFRFGAFSTGIIYFFEEEEVTVSGG